MIRRSVKIFERNSVLVVEFFKSMKQEVGPSSGREHNSTISNVLQYTATAASLAGGILLAIPHWMTFVSFLIASSLWIAFGLLHKHWGLVATQFFFTVINIVSLIRVFTGSWHS